MPQIMLAKNLTQKIFLAMLVASVVFAGLLVSQAIYAQEADETTGPSCVDGLTDSGDPCFSVDLGKTQEKDADNPIYQRLNQVIKFASIGIGIAVTLSVVIAGIQWSASGGEPQKKAAAVSRLANSAIALIVFALGWLILNWLVPGGWAG